MLNQRKGSNGLTFLSRERSLVSIRYIIVVISAGSFVIGHVLGSRMKERLMGVLSFCCLLRDNKLFIMDFKASLGLFMNMASRADPYIWQRILLASFLVYQVATWCSL